MRPATTLDSGRTSNVTEPPPAETKSSEGPEDLAPDPCPDPWSRLSLLWLAALFLFIAFIQAPGKIEADTKLTVVTSPIAWIHGALHLWTPNLYSGATQSLNFGYLFPMAPFFALMHLLHVPVWCSERIWLALLFTASCWGVVRLAEALGIGSRWVRVLGGVAYVIAPISVTWTSRTGTLIAVLLLPWLIQPLVVGARTGSPRKAAARSGVALAFMGGVNATVIVAVLPLGVLWLLTRQRGPRRRALTGWWILSVVLATFWWAVPALLQSKYSYNYLPYTETSATTTSTTSLFEAFRGSNFWLNYFSVTGPFSSGTLTLVTSAWAIMGGAVVAALGLAGLARRIPERLFLVASMSFGAVVIAIGYAGTLAGPFSTEAQHLLQGKLAPLRNVSKFSPDVTLPLVLGLIYMVSNISWAGARSRLTRQPQLQRSSRYGIGIVAVLAVFLAAMPFWKAQLYPSGGFSAIPSYWTQTANWLDAHQGQQTSLLVPGAPQADYTWGKPLNEPLQVLASNSFTARSLIPLGSDGNTVMLTAINSAFTNGTSPPGLAEYLSRSGIDYVVERNDLNLPQTGAPPPALVHQVLSQTTGLEEVASFGPYIAKSQAAFGKLPVYSSPTALHLHAIEIFRVVKQGGEVQTYPAKDPLVVSGSTDSLLPLAGSGVLTGKAAVLAGDPDASGVSSKPGSTWVITDGNQRVNTSFGSIDDNTSYLLGAKQNPTWLTPGVPLTYKVVGGKDSATVAAPIGADSVSSSSFGSTPLFDLPVEGPSSAFDGDSTTAWVADSVRNSVGQSLSITLDRAVPLRSITITPLNDLTSRPSISKVTITTDRGSVQRTIPRVHSGVQVSVAPGATRHVTIAIDDVRPPVRQYFLGPLGAGIIDVAIPGVHYQPAMQLPRNELSAYSAPTSNSSIVSLSQPVPNATSDIPDTTDVVQPIDRKLDLPKAEDVAVTGTVVATPTPDLEAFLGVVAHPTGEVFNIKASTWLGQLPRFRPENLVQTPTAPWIAGLGDTKPTLHIAWFGPKTVSSITLGLSANAATPKKIVITSPVGTRTVTVPKNGGTISFAPMTTNILNLTFVGVEKTVTSIPTGSIPLQLPVGLESLGVPGVTTQTPSPIAPTTPISTACGNGPIVKIDGTAMKTSVTGTVGDLINLQPMTFTVCGVASVPLAAGNHVISFPSGGAFLVTALTAQSPSTATAAVAKRSARITSWYADNRTVALSAGPATYVQVAQNYNKGWVATLHGKTLTPIRLDGWEQGWIVPAGTAGTVIMTMKADAAFHVELIIGALLLVALALLAFTGRRRSTLTSVGPMGPLPGWILAVVGGLVAVAVGGWLALALIPLVVVAHRWGNRIMAIVAGGVFVLAGIAVAADPSVVPGQHLGAFGGPAQIASVIALCAVLAAVIVEERRQPATDPDPPVAEEGLAV